MSTQKLGPVQFSSLTENPEWEGVRDVAPEELALKASTVHLIDVRRPDEFAGELGHIQGSRLIVLDTLPDHLAELPKDEPIVFVCRSGGRSARAAAFALGNGYTDVYNMKGGMLLWNALGLEVER